MRQTTQQTWAQVAQVVGKRSLCVRAQVGAVIVGADGRIVSTGYNGPPSGFDTKGLPCSSWCRRSVKTDAVDPGYTDCVSVHAEVNAIAYADRSRMQDGTIYIPTSMCYNCAKLVANSGISTVIWPYEEPLEHRSVQTVLEFLETCGIKVIVINDKDVA